MVQKLTESNIAECQAKFNLSYHVPYARICQDLVGFEGKDVLEVGGSLPPEFVFDYLHVNSWSAIETPDYEESLKDAGGLSHTGTIIPNIKDTSNLGFDNRKLEKYNFFLENIENLPQEYYGKYDLIFSIATFEHIHQLPAALDKMFLALKPGGKLFSMFSPIWSAHDGHHLPKITDQTGKVFDFGNSPIPPWGHLLMKPDELCHYLYQYTDKETAELMVDYVYNSPHINRYFTEDYLEIIKASKFKNQQVQLTFKNPIDEKTQEKLEKSYQGKKEFSNNGILVVLEKEDLEQKILEKREIEQTNMKFQKDLLDQQKEISSEYPSLNVLIFFLGPRELYRPVLFSKKEIFCSPDCDTRFEEGLFQTIKTPVGVFDVAEVVNRLPQSQKPDMVVVKPDSTGRIFPVNLNQLSCPKLLICGDSHHLQRPIQKLLNYASKEKFDYVMSVPAPHHLHYFQEAGFEKVFWIPAFHIYPHNQALQILHKYKLTFVGQAGKFHPYRKYILQRIRQLGFPLHQFQTSHEQAAEIYADSLINLNVSLNGDMNLRIFEVISSGGFLLTDKLSKQSRLNMLFESGKDLITFRNEFDLQQKLKFFLQNPRAAQEIARNGYKKFWENHRPELNIKRLFDYIDGKKLEAFCDIKTDKRSVYVTSKNSESLNNRIAVYEYIQELHLNQTNLKGLFWSQVDPRIVCDAVDLPRLDIHLIVDGGNTTNLTNLFMECEISDQITFCSYPSTRLNERYDFIALTLAELEIVGADNLLKLVNVRWLIITDATNISSEENQKLWDELLERRGFVKKSDRPLVYEWQRKSDWGTLLLSQQQLLPAVKAFEWALQDNPDDVTALLELGILCLKLKHLERAEQLLEKAVSLDRRHPIALEYFSQVLENLHKYEKNKDILEHLVSINSQDLSLWLRLENCYRQLGLDEKALEVYRYCQNLKTGKILSETPIDISNKSTAKTELKRILVINNIYPPQELGGYGRYISDFANILRDRGHNVQVLTSDAPYLGEIKTNEKYVDRNLLLTGNYEKLPPKPLENESEIKEVLAHNNQIIRNTISSYAPDVCLVGNIDFLSNKVFQPFLENQIPVIHHVAFDLPGYPIPNTPQNPIYHLSACSEYVKQNILSNGYPLQDISVIYPGAFVNRFRMPVSAKFEKLRIAFASLVLPYKGPQTLVEAMSILHNAGIDFHCSIAGDTPDENFLNQLKSFTRSQGIEDKVDFLGYLSRPQLLSLYGTHNVFVFPSVWQEPFGISQIEGMAAGMLLITSGTGGASEVVENNVSGLTFPPGNAESLAAALMKLVEDREAWKNIAMAGVRRAFDIFDIEKSVDILESKFDEILKIRDGDLEFLQNKYQAELKENLRLREINLVIFPDWSQSDESVGVELQEVIKAIASHPDKARITLLIDNSNISDEDADLALSSVAMNLLMEEDLDVSEGPEISIIGNLSQVQWQTLLSIVKGKIVLENENSQAICLFKAENMPAIELDSLGKKISSFQTNEN